MYALATALDSACVLARCCSLNASQCILWNGVDCIRGRSSSRDPVRQWDAPGLLLHYDSNLRGGYFRHH